MMPVKLVAGGRDLKIKLIFPCRLCGELIEHAYYKFCPKCGSRLSQLEKDMNLTMNNERAMRILAFRVRETVENLAMTTPDAELYGVLKKRFCTLPEIERDASGRRIDEAVWHDLGNE